MLRHELVELFLVLGVTQAIEEVLEFGLLLLEAAQRFHAVFVESAVAARGRPETAEEHAALHARPHPLLLDFKAVPIAPTSHFSASDCEEEKRQAEPPPQDETHPRQ